MSGNENANAVVRGPEFTHDRPKDHSKEEPEFRLPDSGIDYAAVAEEELVRAVLRGRPANLRTVAEGWQKLGSTDRRLRACYSGVQAVIPPPGAPELRDLELYLKVRANGMPIEGPSIRR